MKTMLRYWILLLGFVLTLFVNISFGQEVVIENYSFLKKDADTVVLYGQSERMFKTFGTKFQQLIKYGNTQINILHIGDSHLQADIYTSQVRKNLQSFLYGLDGAAGMITPYVKGGPSSYKLKFSDTWKSTNIVHSSNNQGLWGTTAYTEAKESSVEVFVNNKNPIKYDFNSFRMYHSPLAEQDNIILEGEIAYQKVSHPDKGYTDFILADYVQEVKIIINKQSNSTFYLYGFYFNNDNPGIVYNISGTIGASCTSYLLADNMLNQLSTIPTDMIIISLGTNDTYEPGGENNFEANLTKLVTQIRSVKKDVPILLITPVECYYHRKRINPRQTKTVEIINNVAKNNSCAYLDMYNVLGGKGSSNYLFSNALMQKDRVHLTAKGYQLEGDLLFNALWSLIEKNL